ncbi:thermonuclease family protein, partial [Mesorhizobium silamurunense]
VAEDLIAPPPLDVAVIERIEPRPPLGELGLASPPKTPMPQEWRETLLYRPVATSSAIFEAMGRRVVISGTVDIDPDRTCSFGDAVWPCGQRARAALNAWLRGRALKCILPPDVDRFAVAAPCILGRQDVGAWLVANGWAMASPSGIYGKAESVARGAEMGIFGPPQ